jgi:hypothetical protein
MIAKKVILMLEAEVVAPTIEDIPNVIKMWEKDFEAEYTTLGKKMRTFGKLTILDIKELL